MTVQNALDLRLTRRAGLGLFGGVVAATSVGLASCTPGENANMTSPTGTADLESPMLAQLVEAGELPPLPERLPTVPAVVTLSEGPGIYGGNARFAVTVDGVTPISTWAHAGFLEWDRDMTTLLPCIVESFEAVDGNTAFTMTMREGLRWSDGTLYSKDDVEFVFNSFFNHTDLVPAVPYYYKDAGGNRAELSWESETTFTVRYPEPSPIWPKYMAHPAIGYMFMQPKHYLEQFHADFVGEAEANAQAKKAGFDSWTDYFGDRGNPWKNPDLPVMGAWQITNLMAATGTTTMKRNAFYFKTDPDGRQLPYVDQVTVQLLGQEALELRTANGELDLIGNGLSFTSSQVLIENADTRGYEVRRWEPQQQTISVMCNVSHKDPVLRQIFADVRFRRAISHAIDRNAMNDALLSGLGVPTQAMVSQFSEYFPSDGGQQYMEFDVGRANDLLDEVGLPWQGNVRTRPDGSKLELIMIYVERAGAMSYPDATRMVAQNLADVGITVIPKSMDTTVYTDVRASNDFDMNAFTPGAELDLEPSFWIPTANQHHWAPAYGAWYLSKGAEGERPTDDIQELMDNWDRLQLAATNQERIAAGQAIMKQHDDNIYMIGLLRPPFQPVVVTDRTHNVREDSPALSFYFGREGIVKPEQMWLED